ncbi:MAG TPA: Ig-like domain-containing protein [Kiritimatiellia bacterium]|nr:Ig-like domain-containing protein [Kiritimatiellia bacterium]
MTIVNTNQGFVQNIVVGTNGLFTGNISANGGDGLRLTAFHAPTSPSNSAPTFVTVPTPPAVTNLIITPNNRTFTAAGQFQDFVVTAQLAGGGTSNVTSRSSFSSSASSVASVNQAGRLVAQNNGIATLTATFKTNTAQAAITVDIIVLTNFTVHVSKPILAFPGDTTQISVTGQYSNGTSAPLFSGISYGAQNPSVATVNGAGVITALADGSANFSVGVGGLPPKTVSVGVTFGLNPPPVVSFVNPPPGTLVERGQTLSVSVQAVDPTGGVTRVILTSTGELVSSNEQVFAVTPNTTRSFNPTVPPGAALGGAITFRAWAVDVGGMVSATQSLNVTVADLTAPAVSILSPTNGQSFNEGSTVTVVVASSDAVGVGEVRYTAAGALSSSGVQTNPFPVSATNTFSFIIPPGALIPDVYLTAFARDAAGNERTSTPVQIVLTGADITPPATIITAASAPGSSVSNLLSYTVTEGLDDLAYVQIYFRRNGIGTYNLYTETSGTNILGRFFPQSGTNGTVVFDSTRMGGDGFYEFYSVGVDLAGNREIAPTNADQVATFNAGTVWVHVNASTNISASDFSLDNVNLRISNAVVTIEGAHTFHNVELLGTSRISHASATASNEPSFHLTLWSLSMTSNASINVTGRGYLGGQQPGNPFNEGRTTNQAFGSTAQAGGSHGGIGGLFSGSIPGPLYGNLQQPTELGSGGGSRGDSVVAGGNGGGRIRISAINIAADGSIRADGNTGNGWQSGGGSGGSIFLVTRTLSGLGLVTANGGGNEVGGGGGRVSVQHTDISTKDTSLIRAVGFDGTQADGGNGTVFLKGPEDNNGTLMIDGLGVVGPFNGLPIPVGVTFDHIILRNNARVVVDDPIVVRDSLEIQTGAVLTHSTAQTNGLHITANRVVIDATSAIDVTGRGYRGGYRDGNNQNPGETLGGQTGAENRVGGSHGGLGGNFSGLGNNLVYGSPYDPIHLGAGGGSRGDSVIPGANGGGRITIVASNSVTVHGSIRANGGAAGGWQSGGGAGGSIKISTPLFLGTGSVTANGGGNEVGGGGGRILVEYDLLGLGSNDFNGVRNITASGFRGNIRHGSSGSVLMRQSTQAIGDLILDATTTNATAQLWSPLTPIGLGRSVALTTNTLTLDGAVNVLPGGLVGLTLRPNVNSSIGFAIVDNTQSTITVAVSGPTNLLTVAAIGDVYAAEYRFDNVILRRGAWLVTSDRLIVNQAFLVTENSVVTHYTSKTNYLPGLDIVAGQVFVASNSALNVDGRGYLGGQQPGNPFNEARTLDNAFGSAVQAGGSHGGIGGQWNNSVAGPIYGSITTPDNLGAGGGSRGDSVVAGANGGGRIRLVAETVTVHGVISAGGANGLGWNSGSGAGGSILISASAVEGDGILRANGGVGEVAGAGGRVALYYTALGVASSNIQARGGDGTAADSGHGTVFLKTPSQALGTLVIDGADITTPEDSTPLPPGYVFDQIVFRNRARVLADVPVVATDTISLLASSRVSHTRGFLPGLVVTSANVIVDSTSAFDVSAKGYRGGQRAGFTNNAGETAGSVTGSSVFAGGSYGGLGGRFNSGVPNPIYGVPAEPVWLGSGGSSRGDALVPGGNGGGRITLDVRDSLTLDGFVLANGQAGSSWSSGGGSGGSVLLRVGMLDGSGRIQANGGGNEVGGGGGRIAIFYTNLVFGVTNISTTGGSGYSGSQGGNGTVLLVSNTQTNGDLIVDGYGLATPTDSTPMPTNVVFDNVIVRNGARVQLVEPLTVMGTVQITSNSVITHPVGLEPGLRIEAQSLFIGTNSAIDVSARGYRGGQRDGNVANTGETTNGTPGSTVFAGGSHGGLGGAWSAGVANPTYGSVTNPVLLGSGGSSRGDAVVPGGNGGGRITLVIAGGITNDGRIVADGQTGSGWSSGGGSGGSIKISANSLSGDGMIEADGGGNEVGGGGGRIAIYVNALSFATNRVTVSGGPGYGGGGAGSPGTVYFGVAPGPLGLMPLALAPGAQPGIQSARMQGQDIVVVWEAGPEGVYLLQHSHELTPSAWTTLQYLIYPAWTGTPPLESERGFIRIVREE